MFYTTGRKNEDLAYSGGADTGKSLKLPKKKKTFRLNALSLQNNGVFRLLLVRPTISLQRVKYINVFIF